MKDDRAPPDYHRLSVTEKRAHDLARMREPSVTCPVCDTQLMPADLPKHLDAWCPGPREPGPGARWVVWREALQHVPMRTLQRWVNRGYVRTRGDRGDRQYFLRDLVVRKGFRKLFPRR